MAFVKIPTDRKDPFWKKTANYMELSGDWYGGLPVRALCIAADQYPADGKLPVTSIETLESVLGWKGKKGRAETALIEAGLIDKDGNSYRVNREVWEALGSHVLKFHLRAHKAAKALWKGVTVDATSNA